MGAGSRGYVGNGTWIPVRQRYCLLAIMICTDDEELFSYCYGKLVGNCVAKGKQIINQSTGAKYELWKQHRQERRREKRKLAMAEKAVD